MANSSTVPVPLICYQSIKKRILILSRLYVKLRIIGFCNPDEPYNMQKVESKKISLST